MIFINISAFKIYLATHVICNFLYIYMFFYYTLMNAFYIHIFLFLILIIFLVILLFYLFFKISKINKLLFKILKIERVKSQLYQFVIVFHRLYGIKLADSSVDMILMDCGVTYYINSNLILGLY